MAKLPYTYCIPKKSGKVYWRFRKADLQAPLPGAPGDPNFHRRYGELLALSEVEEPTVADGTYAALTKAYLASAEFSQLREPTKKDYRATLAVIDDKLGEQPYRLTTPLMVKAVRDSFASTPRKAHKIKQMVSRLHTWAQEAGLDKYGHNPAADFKRLKSRTKIIMPWSEEEITLFLAHAPLHLRTAAMLALYTGQRAEDVVTMDWTAYQGRFIRVRQSKTGEPIDIACHPTLAKHLDKVRSAFKGKIARAASGRPYTANGFAKAVSDCCAKIDRMPPNRSPHGLRYAAAGRMEEAGCTVAECTQVLGHRTYQMAVKYMSGRRDSASGMARVVGE